MRSKRAVALGIVSAAGAVQPLVGLAGASPAGAQGQAAQHGAPPQPQQPAEVAVGTRQSRGVHPGAIVLIGDRLCTESFMFRDGAGQRYIATAGHCLLANGAQSGQNQGVHVWGPSRGPVALDSQQRRIGTIAYAALDATHDFSLIRLDPAVKASPTEPQFGGPTGLNTTTSDRPTALHFFGNGVGIGDTQPARSATAPRMTGPLFVEAYGRASDGDSGSAVESSDGRAVGLVSTYASEQSSSSRPGKLGVARLGPQMHAAEQALSTPLELQLASPR